MIQIQERVKHQLTLGSLFDGIGGFPFAAELSGIKPIWAAEVEPFCIAVTKHRFPDMLHLGSVTDINGAEIPPVDIITFGSPCQDLSLAGARKGLDGERSGLFKEAVRIIYEMREATNGKYPTFIVWENVPGAFSSNKGRDFRTVLEEITKTDIPMPASGRWAAAGVVRGGAICAAWRQLDAQYWGVPQRRKRIYLIGSFGSNAAEEILFERDSVQRYLAQGRTQREEIAAVVGECINGTVYDARGNGDGKCAPTITGDHNNRVSDYTAIILQSSGFPLGFRAENTKLYEEKATTLCSGTRPGYCNGVVCYPINEQIATRCKALGRGTGLGVGENGDPAFTILANHPHAVCGPIYALDRAAFNQGINAQYDFEISDKGINSTLVAKGPAAVAYEIFFKWIVRRLTPLECERLQGYPDYWTCLPKMECISDGEVKFWKKVILTHKLINGKKAVVPLTKEGMMKWYNKLEVDGSRYKALGNSLAIPNALRVIGYIAKYMKREAK